MDDATLVRDAVGGSVPAFTAIFNRHEAQVHDLALAMLRDRNGALEVVHATFLEASERLESLKRPERLLVWLLAIARFHAVLAAGPTAGIDRQPAGHDDDAERAQQAGLVWEASADLPLRERALLDLHLRQGLEGEDLGDALGVSPAEVTDLRAGLDRIDKGLAGYLIMRRADGRCADLPLVLRGWDGRFNALVCTHVAAHVEACRVCRQIVATSVSPLALYASAPRAPLPGPVTTGPGGPPGVVVGPFVEDSAATDDQLDPGEPPAGGGAPSEADRNATASPPGPDDQPRPEWPRPSEGRPAPDVAAPAPWARP